ncbi:hypothetical protein P9112_004362 [Eukaryota sp. TZLM1-RC]
MGKLLSSLVCAIVGALGLIAVFYAAVTWREYGLLLILAFGVLSPLAELVTKADDSFGEPDGFVIMGKFVTAALATSGFCLPILLFHIEKIEGLPLAIGLVGAFLFYSSIFLFVEKFAPDGDKFSF